jgi:hypothetical protein
MSLGVGELRNNICAEVIIFAHAKGFARTKQDKGMSKRGEDIERREAIAQRRVGVEEGAAARRRGKPISANPYRYDPITYTRSGVADFALRAGWDQGWRSAIWPDHDRSGMETEDDAWRLKLEKRLAESSVKSKAGKRGAK